MKYTGFFCLLAFCTALLQSAQAKETTGSDSVSREKTLFEKITKRSQRNEWLKVDLNTRISFHSIFSDEKDEKSSFRLDYLRLQVEGDITDRIFYKWLQHLNRSNKPARLDNMPSSIDCAGVGFRITPTLSTFIGKQYTDFGGFEYDANPGEIYEYSDLGEAITCFLVGANLIWKLTPSHELRFQVVNAHSGSTGDTYGKLPEEMETAKTPLGYTLNWNGNFINSELLTRCSFSVFHETRKQNVYFLALGTAWIRQKFNMYLDFMYSAEDIDRLGILSGFMTNESNPVLRNSSYISWVSRINYRPLPKWNLFVKGIYETASISRTSGEIEKGKYRTAYACQGGVEYFPMYENLRFFLMYRYKQYLYTSYAAGFDQPDTDLQRLSLGLIYKIPVF